MRISREAFALFRRWEGNHGQLPIGETDSGFLVIATSKYSNSLLLTYPAFAASDLHFGGGGVGGEEEAGRHSGGAMNLQREMDNLHVLEGHTYTTGVVCPSLDHDLPMQSRRQS